MCRLLSDRYRDAILQFLLMLLNGKANSLSCQEKVSKLEVKTFKRARLKCEDKIY